jgi:hypothetical protein
MAAFGRAERSQQSRTRSLRGDEVSQGQPLWCPQARPERRVGHLEAFATGLLIRCYGAADWVAACLQADWWATLM